MSIPKPPLDLTGHCSAVFNNTLFTFSPAGFQSLPLSEGAEWETLSPGVSVTGGICVPGKDSLFIVGGSPNATSASYSGLQQYSFASKSWQTITPVVPVTQNRQFHGAAYINSSSSILVYAGSQTSGDNGPSSQTFLISTLPPFDILSFSSQGAPPLVSPMILPWDNQRAVMIGGSSTNKQVFTFGQPEGWVSVGTTLADPIANPSTTQCTIVTGDDGSKVLEMYDMGVTPNKVTRFALWANGAPAPVGQVVGAPTSARRRRDLTVNNWPAYNSTLAPRDTRSGYALADSSDGLVVISGGASADPIAVFDQRGNTWVNATSLLVSKNQVPLSSPTSTSSLPSVSVVSPGSATASSSPTSTSIATAGANQPKSKVLTVLGGTLGAIFGLAAILILILVLLRYKREKNKTEEQEIKEKDGRLSFADQGAEFMHEAGGSRGRAYSESINGPVGSLQMFNKSGSKGKVNTHKRGVPSDSSQLGLVKAKSPLGINEPLEMSQISGKTSPNYTAANSLAPSAANSPPRTAQAPIAMAAAGPDEDTERSRSNGWSRYFANNEVTNLASMESGRRSTYGTDAQTYRTSESRSEYDDPRNMSNSSVRPLELNLGPKFDGQRLSRVATGSPTMGRSHNDIQEGLAATISRAESTSSRGSDTGYTYMSSTRDGNSTRDGTSTWTPVSNAGWSDGHPKAGDTKSMGSVYSNSGETIASGNPYFATGTNPYHVNDPTTNYFSKGRKAESPPSLPDLNLDFAQHNFGESQRDSQSSQITVFPSGLAGSPKLSAFPKGQLAQKAPPQQQHEDFDFPMPKAYFGGQNRDSSASGMTVASNITVFPRGVPSPTVSTFPKPKLVDARSPPVPPVPPVPDSPNLRRGPVLRKTTGDEDMSWLNINAGRAI
jgi:hypothetical protein